MSVKSYIKRYNRKQAVVITSEDKAKYFTVDEARRLVTYKRFCDAYGGVLYANAHCNSNDTFDVEAGMRLAKARWVRQAKTYEMHENRFAIENAEYEYRCAAERLARLSEYGDCLDYRRNQLDKFIKAQYSK